MNQEVAALMRQALEIMERETQPLEKYVGEQKPAEPEHKPVAWGVMKRGERVWYVDESRAVCQAYAQHYAHRDANGPDQLVIPLYAAPPARKPLTDEEINALADKIANEKLVGPTMGFRERFARAIERAHGITE